MQTTKVVFTDTRDEAGVVTTTATVTHPTSSDALGLMRAAVADYIRRNYVELDDYHPDGGWETFDWSTALEKLRPEDWAIYRLTVTLDERWGEDNDITENLWPSDFLPE